MNLSEFESRSLNYIHINLEYFLKHHHPSELQSHIFLIKGIILFAKVVFPEPDKPVIQNKIPLLPLIFILNKIDFFVYWC